MLYGWEGGYKGEEGHLKDNEDHELTGVLAFLCLLLHNCGMLLLFVLFFEFEELFDDFVGFDFEVILKMFPDLLVKVFVLAVQPEITLHSGTLT